MRIRKLLTTALVAATAAVGLAVVTPTAASAAVHGPYLIFAEHSGMCVRIWHLENDVDAEQGVCNAGDSSQWWAFVDTTNGYYRIRNERSRKCLNVKGGSSANNAQVIEYTCGGSGTTNDQWRPVFLRRINGADYYNLVNRKSSRCMNIKGNSVQSSAKVIQYTCSSGANSSFTWGSVIIE